MKEASDEPKKVNEHKNGETVRGSGFTYDEARDPTDESVPVEKAQGEKIIELPDLGKPNRP